MGRLTLAAMTPAMFDKLKAATPEALAQSNGFKEVRRYVAGRPSVALPTEAEVRRQIEERAYAKGLAEGREQMRLEEAARRENDAAAMSRLEISLGRIDGDQAAVLAERLKLTVLELCETLIDAQSVDEVGLEKRALKVINMLGDAGPRVLKLNPLDMELLAKRLPEGIVVQADPSLERGSLRMETADRGMEDGPQVWRRAIADAMSSC